MSESGTEASASTEGQTTDGNPGGDTSTTEKPINLTQEEFNRQLNERVKRERAKFSDYADAKAKAARFDELEEAQKSEIQKATDRVTAVERERDEARVEGLRFRIATKYGISEEDAALFLKDNDEESLVKVAERLVARNAEQKTAREAEEAERKKKHPNVPKEGTSTPSGNGTDATEREFARSLFGGSA